MDRERLIELTKKVIASEKPGFWSDWTGSQRLLYASGNWKAFSRSRGYTEQEIADFDEWLTMLKEGRKEGLNPFKEIHDLVVEAAGKNIDEDRNGEILLSSHIPTQAQGGLI